MPFRLFLGALFRAILRTKTEAGENQVVTSLVALGIPAETYMDIKQMLTSRVCQGTWAAKERGKQMIFIPENKIVGFIDQMLREILTEAYKPDETTDRMPSSTFYKAEEVFSTFTRKIGWSEINEFAFRIYPEEIGPLLSNILMKAAKALYFEMVPTWNEETSALTYCCTECGMAIRGDWEVCPRGCFKTN